MDGEIIGFATILLAFSIPLSAIWTSHRRQVLEMKIRHQNSVVSTPNASVQAELEALRAEVQRLRDTTMQYDLSFDTSLQRLERRVEQVEQQQQTSVRNY